MAAGLIDQLIRESARNKDTSTFDRLPPVSLRFLEGPTSSSSGIRGRLLGRWRSMTLIPGCTEDGHQIGWLRCRTQRRGQFGDSRS